MGGHGGKAMTCLTFRIFLGKTHWGGMGPFLAYKPYCARTKPIAFWPEQGTRNGRGVRCLPRPLMTEPLDDGTGRCSMP